MFERYTEGARRTIFFARYEASQIGSGYIETEPSCLVYCARTVHCSGGCYSMSSTSRFKRKR
jgi:hypothetical protein